MSFIVCCTKNSLFFTKRAHRVSEWSKAIAFKAGVSQRRFESGRRQTVTVTAYNLWQGSSDLSATSLMTTSDAEANVKLDIIFYYCSKFYFSNT